MTRSFARVPWTHEVEVELERAGVQVPALADIDGTTLRMRVESLDYMAQVLATLDCDFTVIKPPELNDALNRLSRRLQRPG